MLRNRSLISLLVLVAMLVAVACQPITAQSEPAAPPSDEDVVAAVNAIWREYEAAQIASDPDRWVALWTEDGVKMPPDVPALEGKEAIYARAERGMTNAPVDEMVITALETQGAGDWAYSRGTFTVTYTIAETGVQELMDGKFMTILQRQPDGTWKIHRDIHNSNVPPAAPPEPDMAAVTQEINALFTEYGDSLAADDAERWVQLWVEDGVQLPPGAPPNVGRAAILASISSAMEHYAYRDMDIHVDEVLLAGDLAIARGMYTAMLVPHDGSEPILVDGKYTTTFQRQADGTWKIYRDIFNSNVPPAAPAAAEDVDVEAATAAIEALWREYSASALAGDPVRRMALWDEDGIQMPPDREARVGKETIQAATEAGMASVVASEYEVMPEEIEILGDTAYARGVYHALRTPVDGGDPVVTDGKFMTILKRQEDGSWQIYRDIYNSNVPPAPVAAPETDVNEVTEAVNAIWREYEASLLADDAERWIALWADDGVRLPPNAPVVEGKEAIFAGISSRMETIQYTAFVITPEELTVNGYIAISRGVYEGTFVAKAGGDPMQVDGKFMTFLRQQPDGTWKIYRDIFNSNE
ncbi:MAG: nuclear transport factor 2 family protein [Caldilineaceae bacterium]|nr:nuclear transport factor 2 family protein [Caldilineaceae bacterium]MCB0121276.1 nuclear transport factor 2 family protein [Caldilineaceae bacterium]